MLGILTPNPALMQGHNHATDRQPQSAAGTIMAAAVGRVLLEDLVEVLARNVCSGIPDIETIRICCAGNAVSPFRFLQKGMALRAPLPECRIPADIDVSTAGCKFTGIVHEIDQHLFNLAGFHGQGNRWWDEIHGNRNTFALRKWMDLV